MRNFYNTLVKYCKNFTEIENYELARADDFVGWQCHHKLELVKTGGVVDATRQDLIDWGIYYDRPADELVFLTEAEHKSLHATGRKQPESVKQAVSKAQKGKKLSDEQRKRMSEVRKGRKPWNKGLKTGPQSEETKRKRSESLKGHVVSDETKRKIRDAQLGKSRSLHWFTDGFKNVLCENCPDGFHPGRKI